MLAREIHDVAGEIDSVSPSSAPSATVRKQPDVNIITTSMPTYASKPVFQKHADLTVMFDDLIMLF